jgi:3-methyladenine DNA glycosylase AlkD
MQAQNIQVDEVVAILRSEANADNVKGMQRFGINTEYALGINIPFLRTLAKKYKKNHSLALALWQTGFHEARLLAGFIADVKQTDNNLMDSWVKDINSWDLCDQVCGTLFCRTPQAPQKAFEYIQNQDEFTRRVGFVLMATMAIHRKELPDALFIEFLNTLSSYATDPRNMVKKAVNWALRQIGKRNVALHHEALITAQAIKELPDKTAKWIAADALRELKSHACINRVSTRKKIPIA